MHRALARIPCYIRKIIQIPKVIFNTLTASRKQHIPSSECLDETKIHFKVKQEPGKKRVHLVRGSTVKWSIFSLYQLSFFV